MSKYLNDIIMERRKGISKEANRAINQVTKIGWIWNTDPVEQREVLNLLELNRIDFDPKWLLDNIINPSERVIEELNLIGGCTMRVADNYNPQADYFIPDSCDFNSDHNRQYRDWHQCYGDNMYQGHGSLVPPGYTCCDFITMDNNPMGECCDYFMLFTNCDEGDCNTYGGAYKDVADGYGFMSYTSGPCGCTPHWGTCSDGSLCNPDNNQNRAESNDPMLQPFTRSCEDGSVCQHATLPAPALEDYYSNDSFAGQNGHNGYWNNNDIDGVWVGNMGHNLVGTTAIYASQTTMTWPSTCVDNYTGPPYPNESMPSADGAQNWCQMFLDSNTERPMGDGYFCGAGTGVDGNEDSTNPMWAPGQGFASGGSWSGYCHCWDGIGGTGYLGCFDYNSRCNVIYGCTDPSYDNYTTQEACNTCAEIYPEYAGNEWNGCCPSGESCGGEANFGDEWATCPNVNNSSCSISGCMAYCNLGTTACRDLYGIDWPTPICPCPTNGTWAELMDEYGGIGHAYDYGDCNAGGVDTSQAGVYGYVDYHDPTMCSPKYNHRFYLDSNAGAEIGGGDQIGCCSWESYQCDYTSMGSGFYAGTNQSHNNHADSFRQDCGLAGDTDAFILATWYTPEAGETMPNCECTNGYNGVWTNGGFDQCGVCGGDNSSCTGCTDSSACNWDGPSYIIDDGSCLYPGSDEYPCDCDQSIEPVQHGRDFDNDGNGCCEMGHGEMYCPAGSAYNPAPPGYVENCFMDGYESNDQLNIAACDCLANGGQFDACGVCNGNMVTADCTYPSGTLYCVGSGNCEGLSEGDACAGGGGYCVDSACNGDTVEDCAGECGGDAEFDECGVCNGDNTNCTGCMHPLALNYFSGNIIEDCSCQFEGCLDNNSTIIQECPDAEGNLIPLSDAAISQDGSAYGACNYGWVFSDITAQGEYYDLSSDFDFGGSSGFYHSLCEIPDGTPLANTPCVSDGCSCEYPICWYYDGDGDGLGCPYPAGWNNQIPVQEGISPIKSCVNPGSTDIDLDESQWVTGASIEADIRDCSCSTNTWDLCGVCDGNNMMCCGTNGTAFVSTQGDHSVYQDYQIAVWGDAPGGVRCNCPEGYCSVLGSTVESNSGNSDMPGYGAGATGAPCQLQFDDCGVCGGNNDCTGCTDSSALDCSSAGDYCDECSSNNLCIGFYDENATIDDNSCRYLGCPDPNVYGGVSDYGCYGLDANEINSLTCNYLVDSPETECLPNPNIPNGWTGGNCFGSGVRRIDTDSEYVFGDVDGTLKNNIKRMNLGDKIKVKVAIPARYNPGSIGVFPMSKLMNTHSALSYYKWTYGQYTCQDDDCGYGDLSNLDWMQAWIDEDRTSKIENLVHGLGGGFLSSEVPNLDWIEVNATNETRSNLLNKVGDYTHPSSHHYAGDGTSGLGGGAGDYQGWISIGSNHDIEMMQQYGDNNNQAVKKIEIWLSSVYIPGLAPTWEYDNKQSVYVDSQTILETTPHYVNQNLTSFDRVIDLSQMDAAGNTGQEISQNVSELKEKYGQDGVVTVRYYIASTEFELSDSGFIGYDSWGNPQDWWNMMYQVNVKAYGLNDEPIYFKYRWLNPTIDYDNWVEEFPASLTEDSLLPYVTNINGGPLGDGVEYWQDLPLSDIEDINGLPLPYSMGYNYTTTWISRMDHVKISKTNATQNQVSLYSSCVKDYLNRFMNPNEPLSPNGTKPFSNMEWYYKPIGDLPYTPDLFDAEIFRYCNDRGYVIPENFTVGNPVAAVRAGGPITLSTGEPIIRDARPSYDPDFDGLVYRWRQLEPSTFPIMGDVNDDSSHANNPTLPYAENAVPESYLGPLKYKVTVHDLVNYITMPNYYSGWDKTEHISLSPNAYTDPKGNVTAAELRNVQSNTTNNGRQGITFDVGNLLPDTPYTFTTHLKQISERSSITLSVASKPGIPNPSDAVDILMDYPFTSTLGCAYTFELDRMGEGVDEGFLANAPGVIKSPIDPLGTAYDYNNGNNLGTCFLSLDEVGGQLRFEELNDGWFKVQMSIQIDYDLWATKANQDGWRVGIYLMDEDSYIPCGLNDDGSDADADLGNTDCLAFNHEFACCTDESESLGFDCKPEHFGNLCMRSSYPNMPQWNGIITPAISMFTPDTPYNEPSGYTPLIQDQSVAIWGSTLSTPTILRGNSSTSQVRYDVLSLEDWLDIQKSTQDLHYDHNMVTHNKKIKPIRDVITSIAPSDTRETPTFQNFGGGSRPGANKSSALTQMTVSRVQQNSCSNQNISFYCGTLGMVVCPDTCQCVNNLSECNSQYVCDCTNFRYDYWCDGYEELKTIKEAKGLEMNNSYPRVCCEECMEL